MGVGALTHASPALLGKPATEGYLTQPNLLGALRHGPLALVGTLNLEGYTLRRGELNAGIYGEGYVDRRHPHTLVHELMLVATTPARRGIRASLGAGKGFTPYGTDDPMMRPFVKYPVNHHHAQIIERIQVLGAISGGSLDRGMALEHAFFNGDEPVGPFIGPQWDRVGDSRATRLTLMPWRGVELQGSRAFVRSPGITQGGAFDHTQSSLSLRVDRGASAHDASHRGMHAPSRADATASANGHARHDARRYLLLEVARTDEGRGTLRAFRFHSMLAEGLVARGGWTLATRVERTERPEQERLLDPFRTANGHIDFQIIGVTRWTIGTVHVTAPDVVTPLRAARFTPYIEVAGAQARAMRTPAVFVPETFYGASTQWSLTAGLRMHVGPMRRRMGRYGVLSPAR
jgi:hypothetical protein